MKSYKHFVLLGVSVFSAVMHGEDIEPKERPQHPYLYFSAEDIPAIRERMENDPALQVRRQHFMSRANSLLMQTTAGGDGNSSRYSQGDSAILAFAYVVTGDVAYAERAIEEVLASVALERWINLANTSFNRGADLRSAERSVGAALVYDWCYDVMTPAQRADIRAGMLQKGIEPYLSTMDPDVMANWYTTHPVNNWRGVCHGGVTVAALALYYESPLARKAAHYGRSHVPMALRDHLLTDSGGHEGVGYNNYGVEYALLGATALQRFFGGMEELLVELADDRLGGYWESYMHAPDLRMVNFSRHAPAWNEGLWSQTGADEGGPQSLRGALFDSMVPGGDQLLRWAADNGGQRFYWYAGSPFYFLWRRAAPSLYREPKPAMQEAVLFRGAGHAILQSANLYVGFNGGIPHERGDVGSLVMVVHSDGKSAERLLSQPGYRNDESTTGNSEYQSTLLVDGAGQNLTTGGPPPRGEFLRFGSGEGFHYLAADIEPLYSGPLNYAVRHLVIVGGRYVVLLDDLAADTEVNFEARFQSEKAISVDSKGGVIEASANRLYIRSAGFDAFAFGQGEGADGLSYISLSSEAVNRATLLTVLYPGSLTDEAPVVTENNGMVTIEQGGTTDKLVFSQANGCWWLSSVNGASAMELGDGSERTIIPFRDGRDDSAEVPSWLLSVIH